jgi:hypothetical protein
VKLDGLVPTGLMKVARHLAAEWHCRIRFVVLTARGACLACEAVVSRGHRDPETISVWALSSTSGLLHTKERSQTFSLPNQQPC